MTTIVCEVTVPESTALSDCAILEFTLKVTFRALPCSSYPPLPPFSAQTLPSLPEPQAHVLSWEQLCSSADRAYAPQIGLQLSWKWCLRRPPWLPLRVVRSAERVLGWQSCPMDTSAGSTDSSSPASSRSAAGRNQCLRNV